MDFKMPQFNRVTVVGRIVHTPETRTTPTGMLIVKFSIAFNHGFGDKQTQHYFDVKCFDKTAEKVRDTFTGHGGAVLVEGRLAQEKWDDKKTGDKRSRVEIIADRVHELEWKEKSGTSERRYVRDEHAQAPVVDDDIPF